MNAEFSFVDTNVLFYSVAEVGAKSARAEAVLTELWESDRGALSVQVLSEFYVNAMKKLPAASPGWAREVVRQYGGWLREPTDLELVVRATELAETARLSFWNAMIVASAARCGARTLLTEDLNHGQVIAGVRIENPFLAA